MRKHLLCFLVLSNLLNAEVICKGIELIHENELIALGEEKPKLLAPESEKNLQAKLESNFLNRAIDSDILKQIRSTVEQFYASQNILALAEIPKQEITDGKIQVCVTESRIDEIKVECNRYTSTKLLKKYLGFRHDDPIKTNLLKKHLDFINRSPFRRVDLVFSPGKTPHTTDLTLLVDERRPFRFYVGTDNIGIPTTERGRCFAGVDFSKMLLLDHFLSFQYTSSYDFSSFQAYTAQYQAYLPSRHVLNLYGGYSSVHADLPFPTMRTHGHSYQASGRYIVPLMPHDYYRHEWNVGFDFKRTNNTIEFSESFPVVGPNVNLSQFVANYWGSVARERFRIDFEAGLYYSPGAMLSDESDSDYSALRPGAKNHWVYGRAYLRYFQKLTQSLSLSMYARGQLSSQNLLPSEQVGLGGFDSVRGYDERQLNYDSGYIFNVELLTRTFTIFSDPKCKKRWKDGLQFLGFIDYGAGSNHNLIPGERKHDFLCGAGPGVRYTIDPWITARLDLGVKLHDEAGFTGGKAMWYFSFIGNL